ncbi:sigma 54-interacting transcriptional regulator [Neobacillus niacini]|uniref:sigma-54 interaction domain-containing protein n=1 Tax=Neobacillus niacini TaxID=86668 RepID=UPI003000D941
MLRQLLSEENTLEFLPHILNDIYDGIVIMTSDSTIVYVNDAYTRILGIPRERVLGKKANVIEPTARSLEILKTKENFINKFEVVKSLGRSIVVSASPIFIYKEFKGVFCTFSDVTEIIQLSKEIERLSKNEQILKNQMVNLKKQLNEEIVLPSSFSNIIGQSHELMKTLKLASQVAPTNASILIHGESGVGKELVAKAIHYSSDRRDKPFIAINCASLPDSLVESELFGYDAGAFTGANRNGQKGKFELAHNGTLFLDEIGDMPLNIQVKILRVIQEGEVIRIGSPKPVKVNVRIISATHQDLPQLIQEGKFREDLFYRLNVIPLNIPSLKTRKDDIILIAEHFLDKLSNELNKELYLSTELKEILTHFHWPGNVRELENVIKHCAFVSSNSTITKDHLPHYLLHNQKFSNINPNVTLEISPEDSNQQEHLRNEIDLKEKEVILQTLKKTNNNRTEAMKILGISRRTFYQKLKKHNLLILNTKI